MARIDQQRRSDDVVEQDFENAVALVPGFPPAVRHHQEEYRHGEGLENDQRIGPHMVDPRPLQPEDIGRGEENRPEQSEGDIGEEHRQHARPQPQKRVADETFVVHGAAAHQQRQRDQYAEGQESRLRDYPRFESSPERQRDDRCPAYPVDAPPRGRGPQGY